jgi:3' exoribonuclease, RNase T-like
MTQAISLDIETMATAYNAAISSIGACRFDLHGNGIGDWINDTFHINVSLTNCQRHGLTFDASTVLWWMKQPDEARQALIAGQQDAAPLIAALEALADFIGATQTASAEDAPTIWANGASFDLPILANAYRVVGMPIPWRFWQERDLRTLKAIYGGCVISLTGIPHHALDDAVYQAHIIQAIAKANPEIFA